MSKSLRWKFVVVMLLMIVLLMTVVCVFLIQGVQQFYTDEFFRQMTDIFEDENINADLRNALVEGDREATVGNLSGLLDLYQGALGINSRTRNLYILDEMGNYVKGTNVDGQNSVSVTHALLQAKTAAGNLSSPPAPPSWRWPCLLRTGAAPCSILFT